MSEFIPPRPLSPISQPAEPPEKPLLAAPHFSDSFAWRLTATILWLLILAGAVLGLLRYGIEAPEGLFSDDGIESMWLSAIPLMILVGPMALVMLGGGMDFTTGAVTALASVAVALALTAGYSPLQAFGLAMLVTGSVGLIHAILLGVTSINPFILTFITAILVHGGTLIIAGDQYTIAIESDSGFISSLYQSPIVLAASAGISLLMIHLAQRGKSVDLASSPSPWRRRTLYGALPYVLSSLFAGILGCAMAANAGMGSPGTAGGRDMLVIIAAIIGGNCTGRLHGTLVGALAGVVIIVGIKRFMMLQSASEETTNLTFAAAAGAALLLSQFVYWIINLIYRMSHRSPQLTA